MIGVKYIYNLIQEVKIPSSTCNLVQYLEVFICNLISKNIKFPTISKF